MIRITTLSADDAASDVDTSAERLLEQYLRAVDAATADPMGRSGHWAADSSWWLQLLDQTALLGLQALISNVHAAWSRFGAHADGHPRAPDLSAVHALMDAEPPLQIAVLRRAIADLGELSARRGLTEQHPESEWRRLTALGTLATSLLGR